MGNSKSKWRFHSSKDTCTYPIKYGVEEQSDISEEHLSNAEHNDVHKCVTAINIGTIHGGTVHINCYDDTRTKHRFNSNLVNSVERRKSKIIKFRGNKYEGKQLNKVPRFKQKLKQLFGRCHCESASDLPPGSKTRGLAHISQPVNSDSESAQQFIHVDSTPDDHSTEPDLYEALYVRENADDVVRASERQQCKQVTSNDACSASHSLISVEKESADTSIIGTQESDLSIRENTHLKTGTVDSTLNSNESYISVKDNISNMQYKIYEHFKSKHYRQAERTPTFLHSLPANTCKKEKHIQSERNDGNNLRQNCSVSNNSEVRCDVSTYRKHDSKFGVNLRTDNEDSKQYSKLCQNTSVFSESSDEHTEIETSFPQLDLQCDCNSFLEFSALKLPDPFYTTEETEEKHSNFEWTSQTDTVPTGYPWNTGSSEGPHFCTDGFISSDLTESTEEISSKFQTNYGLDVYRKYLEMEMISTGLEDIHVEGSTALCWEQSKNDITGHTVNTTNVEERHSEIGEPEYIQTEQHHVLDCVSTRTEAVKNGEESESEANKGGMDNFMPASPYRNSPISENIDSGVFTLHSKDRETMVRCRENQVVQTNLPNSCCDSKFTRTCIEDRALLIEQVHVQLLWEFLGSDHTPTCFNVLAILHSDKSADNALWIIKVSEEGIMQEVDLFSELQNDRELITVDAEMTESRFKLIEDTSERASVIRDEAIILNSKITDDGSDIDQLNETSNGELATISYKYDSLFVSDSKQEMGVRQGLPVKTVRSLSESNCVDIDLMQVEKFSIKQELSTDACKFHSLPSIATGRKYRIIHTANATYGSKALSESDLQEIKCVHQHVVFYQHINPEEPLFTGCRCESNAVTLPQSRTLPLPDHASDNADAEDECVSDHSRRFSKTVSPGMEINENAVDFSNKEEKELTIKRSKKGRKKLVAKKKRSTKASVPKSENKLSFQYSSDFSSRLHEKKRLKRNIISNKTHQMHQLEYDSHHQNGSNKLIKLFGDISCDNHDSGIGTLTNSMSISSLSMVIGSSSPTGWLLDDYLELDADNSDNRIAMQYLKGKHTRKERNVKMLSCIVKKKFVIKQHRKYFKKFFTACQRQLKSVVRELHVEHRYIVFGIGSYFDRLNNGPPPTIRERMQYEWIRLGTFHNYTGSGNGLALARNGFYHEHTEGSSSTSCFLCDARHSTWEMFDDISAEHRRQSPNCPMHKNREEESVNVSITHDDSSAASSRASASRATSRNVSSTAQSSSSSSSGPKFDSAGSSLSSSSSTVPAGSASSTSAGAVREVSRSLQETHISEVQASRIGGESIPQQPTDDPESRDRSMLALSQPHMQRALGRTGLAYSNIVPPQRNNIATGAASNVGLGPSGSDPLSTASQPPDIRPSSILGGPVGAGAFSGLNTTAQTHTSSKSTASQHNNAATATSSSNARQTNPAPGTGGRTDPTSVVLIDNPKHPDYIHVDVRVSSFQAWPDHLDQTPRQMAEAGFFFVGVADFSRCFCCGGGLRNWEPGDDPMLEHTRWFPRCEYVKKLKGERYVAAVQRRHHEHMAEQQRQQIELAQTRDDNRIPPDPMTTDAAAVMREMGYSIDRTREAILAVRQQTGSTRVTTQQVLAWLLDDEDRRTSHTTELGVRSPASTVSSTHTPTVSTSSPSTLINTGTTVASSIVNTGTSIATSSVPTATSIVIADTTPSTISSTPAINTAEVQQSGTPNSSSSSESGSQQTGTENSSSSSSGSYTTMVEKQSPSSRGDRDEAQSTVAEDTTGREPTNKTAKKKKAKKKTKTGARGGSLDAKSLMAENEKLREMQTCKICMERAVNTTLLPCGHLVCCDMCASRLQRCPICRKRIKGTVKTFMS